MMTAALKPTDMINLSLAPHPFALERIDAQVAAGQTIAEIIAQYCPNKGLEQYAHVYINGEYIERDKWTETRPQAQSVLTVRMVPQGGGSSGKNPLRTVLALAVMAGTGMVAGGISSFFGAGSFLGFNIGSIAAGGINLLGKLALNAIIPPSSSRYASNKESATLFIQGARNEIKPFGRVPKVLGRHRIVPPLGAKAYTELVGDDQYLRMLFVWGYGPLSIGDLKIGETPLEEFDEVEVETRQGYADDAPLTLYSDSVLQDDLQVYLKEVEGYITRTTADDADEISLDITFPQGLVLFKGSNKSSTAVEIEVQYAKSGTNEWIDAGTTAPAVKITAQQSAALRTGLRFKVEKGKYDVRVKRVTADNEDDDYLFNDTIWTALRTIRYESPLNMEGLAVTALRIKATDQLNGVLDKFNGVVSAIIPDWDGDKWVERETSNPASIYRHVLQSSANARPLANDRLDLQKIVEWYETCQANGREYNAVIDYDVSVREILQNVAAAGRASPSLVDGKWGVIEDKLRTSPVQHFTPRNSFGFKGSKAFDDLPHALRVRFINREKEWLQDERLVFDDGYALETASKYETLDLAGVTSPEQAWRDGLYHLATVRLRPETYSFNADIEHIVCTRGDMIKFTHDVPMFGLMSARVKALNIIGGMTNGVTLDAVVEMEATRQYCLRFRLSDGESLLAQVKAVAGIGTYLEFTTPLDTNCGLKKGDLAMFGERGQESVSLVVKSVQPQKNMSAKITCVAYDERIFNSDNVEVPEFVSKVGLASVLQRLPQPQLKEIQSGLETAIKNSDGSITSRVVITLVPPEDISRDLGVNVKVKAAGETMYRSATVISRYGREVSLTDLSEGEVYDIQLRYADSGGALSLPLNISNYRVEGTTALPSDVKVLDIAVINDTAHLSWGAVTDIDLSHYILRLSKQTVDATWGAAVDMVSKISGSATSLAVPAMVGTYMLKAVDAGGRESANHAAAISNIAGIFDFNAVEEIIEDVTFAGVKEGVDVNDGNLTLCGNDGIEDWLFLDNVEIFDIGESGIRENGIYEFSRVVDLGEIYTSRLTAEMAVLATDIYDVVDGYVQIDRITSWDSDANSTQFGINLQISASNDGANWGEWKNFSIGDYSARSFRFRLLLESRATNILPKVSLLRVKVDMPDRVDAQNNLLSSLIGGRVHFNKAFRAVPAISVSAQSMQTGDYYNLGNIDNSGFDIRFYNATGAAVERSFDYLAKGYGTIN